MTKRAHRPVIIRGQEAEDWEDVAAIFEGERVVAGTLQLPYQSRDAIRDRIENPRPDIRVLVAVVEGRVVGTLGLHFSRGRQAHMAHLGMMVHDSYQGQGIGAALLEAARAHGAEGAFNYRDESWGKALRKTAGAIDVVFDGAPASAFSGYVRALAMGARVVLYGSTGGPNFTASAPDLFLRHAKKVRHAWRAIGPARLINYAQSKAERLARFNRKQVLKNDDWMDQAVPF